MNFSGGGNTPSPRRELQGPRPAALKVNKDSHKIRKPPIVPPSSSSQQQQQQHPPPAAVDERQPVIIYAVSPKVIHTTVSDFMNLVQRLTGNNNNNNNNNTTGDLSPAARLASIENSSTCCSPSSSSKDREIAEMVDFLQDVEVGGRGAGGILSPAPASLPPISPGFFSPAAADIGYNNNMFLPSSPSTLFSAPLVSPSPSSSNIQLFNPFFDF